ncbi:MAG: DoxX family protein [Candidatus Hydrogenedentes bacterium]|nr:DoxX family protein [Candidatus Hydrogenedentota bacterium]
MIWAGRVMSALPVLLLLFSGVMKLAQPAGMAEGFTHLGYPLSVAVPLGIVEIACTVLYIVPQTSVLGAILLTGYLGGATATHLRVEEAFFAPIAVGVLVWGGLFLRDARIRALIPLKK